MNTGSGGVGAVSVGISEYLVLGLAVLILIGIIWLAVKLVALFMKPG